MLQKKNLIIIITIICIFLFGGVYIFNKPKEELLLLNNSDTIIVDENETEQDNFEPSDNKIVVYISGEVNRPDVYELDTDSRLNELIVLAGGFTKDADNEKINLSKKLEDEEHIHINKIKEENKEIEEANNYDLLLDDSFDESDEKINITKPAKIDKSDKKININNGTKDELMSLPAIGETIAQKIIDYREQNGDFKSIEDIKEVNRIGDKTFEKIKDLITVK